MSLAQILPPALSALVGGFTGGCVVAFRVGQWRQCVESKLKDHERRLNDGTDRVRQVPILETRLDVIISEIRELKEEARIDRQTFVSREECERTHGRD